MVAVDYETPVKMALSVAKEATPDTTGKDILKRYRELVAQKSAERLKGPSQHEDENQSVDSSSSSIVSSSDGSSLGSMSSIDDIEDEENDIEKDHSEKNDFNGKSSNENNQIKPCKDDLTNELVQEAAMIKNIVKETILEKQRQKQHGEMNTSPSATRTTPMKTPGKNKTPSKFKVFEDVTTCRDNIGHNSALKSQTKRPVLRPKSTNTAQPLNDKKNNSNLTKSGIFQKSPTMQESTQVERRTITNYVTKTKSPKATLSSPVSRPPSALKRNHHKSVEKEESNRIQTDQNVRNEQVESIKRNSPPKQQHQNVHSRTEVAQKITGEVKDTETIVQDVEVTASEDKINGTSSNDIRKANHNTVEREEGELLSLGPHNISTSSTTESMKNIGLDKEDLHRIFDNHLNNEVSVVANDDDDENTCTSSLHTPTSSVQTFSIGGRSYSIDVSVNALRSILTEPPRKDDVKSAIGNDTANDESMTGETMFQDISMRSENMLNDSISPTSQILATSKLDMSTMNGGISRSSAASLIERNKTLIKEVRFADQTCVELSERNAAIRRDVKRMENEIIEMKRHNESLHQVIVSSKQDCAKLEEHKASLAKQIEEQKGYYEAQMRVLQQALKEAKDKNDMLTKKSAESDSSKQTTEKELISTQAKYEALQERHNEAEDKISSLLTRLATSQSTAEVSAASAAQSYREFCEQMEKKVEKLARVSEERLIMYNEEKEKRMEVLNDHSNMARKCAELEKLIENWEMNNNLVSKDTTPYKAALGSNSTPNKEHNKTPTASVLARTLEAELERGHDATERILEAEMIISVTQSELQESSKQLHEAKLEIERLNDRVHELTEQKMQQVVNIEEESEPSVRIEDIETPTHSCQNSSLETMSTDELVGKVLSQKLTYARTECEDYKRELENVLNEIKRLQGESFNSSTSSQEVSNDQTVSGLLHAVRELAQVCAKQADEINHLKAKSAEKKRQSQEFDCMLEGKNGVIADQKKTIETLKMKVDSLALELSSQEEELLKTKSQMSIANQQSMSRLNQKEVEIANQQMKCSDLENKVNELSELCKRQAEDLTMLQSDIGKVNAELSAKGDELNSQNYRQECLLTEVEDIVTRITNIKNQYRNRK